MKLPKEFYRKREAVSEKLAACVLLQPSLCPSRDALPRAQIVDPVLQQVLSLAPLCYGSAEVMAHRLRDRIGCHRTVQLLRRLLIAPLDRGGSRDFALIGSVDLYVMQLKQLQDVEREHENAIRGIAQAMENAERVLNV